MNKQPMISIIVPIYNAEQYLCKTIESILHQTYTDFELLLIDDGSKDRSGNICNEYEKKDNRIRVFIQENFGVSAARNKGIGESQGHYICFVDSDDWVNESFLNDFEITEDIQNGTILIQGFNDCFNGNIYKNNNVSFKYSLCKPAVNTVIESIELFHNGYICSKLFERSILIDNNIRFERDVHMNEDHLFNFDYFRYIKYIKVSSKAGYNYEHRDNNSLSRRRYPYEQRVLILKLFHEKSSVLLSQFSIGKKYTKKIHLFSRALMLETIYAMYRPYFLKIKKERILNLYKLLNGYDFLFSLNKKPFCINFILKSKSPHIIDLYYSIFYKIRYTLSGFIKRCLKKS